MSTLTSVAGSSPLPAHLQTSSARPLHIFGAADWNEHFGDVGAEPPRPPNIDELLDRPCPFWPGRTIRQTHIFALVPKVVNGRPLTAQLLGKLIQKPRLGYRVSECCGPEQCLGDYSDLPTSESHWVLVPRDEIPGSRGKNYKEGLAILANYSQQAKIRYVPSKILDHAVAIAVDRVKNGYTLYSDSFAQCREAYDIYAQLTVGFDIWGKFWVGFGGHSDQRSIAGMVDLSGPAGA